MTRVAVVDYGAGNLLSVEKALEHLGAEVTRVSSPDAVAAAERVVLPGVGAFGDGMAELRKRGLVEAIQAAAASKPLLGICLGMQFLLDESEEFGRSEGLGIIAGKVKAIPLTPGIKVPHVGWNRVRPRVDGAWEATPLAPVAPGAHMYFVHSYAAEPADATHVLALADYGAVQVTAAVGRGRVWGCQFHPEKSGPEGLKILEAFLRA